MYSDLLDKLQNTLSLNYCVELFKEQFPTCWSITSHWWRDKQLNKLYILCFLFVSDLLELLQTIRKTSRLCFPTWWINCKILYHITIVLRCSQNCFQHVGVQLVIDEVMNNYINFIYCAFYLFPTSWNYCKLYLKH